jgi:3-deoxy-D-manno-octulosonic-acid transferase
MSILEGVYSAGLRSLQAAFPLLSRGEGKLARGVRGRAEVLARMRDWAARERVPGRPLAWFHAPSVGEGLQAVAVMEEVRRLRPELQVVYTFFSPSAEGLARRIPADFAGYLPLDTRRAVGEALDALQPEVIAFSKTDVWPNLTREAARRGVRLLMISGTLPASSSRLRGLARRLLLPAYRRLDHVAAISLEDAERFGSLGVPPGRRSVMGDAHFDRVLSRVAAIDRQSGLLRRLEVPQPVLVAGSTWPADEQRLLGVLAELREAGAPLRTILVPHEPSEEHLRQTEARLAALGLASVRLGSLQGAWTGEEILLVDRVGILGELYALAAIAYVGGGYGSAGLHSVLEPAAFGIPVLFGPRHTNAREAGELIRAGGAFVVEDPTALHERVRGLLDLPQERAAAGRASRAYVERGRGAAHRGAATVLAALERRLPG